MLYISYAISLSLSLVPHTCITVWLLPVIHISLACFLSVAQYNIIKFLPNIPDVRLLPVYHQLPIVYRLISPAQIYILV